MSKEWSSVGKRRVSLLSFDFLQTQNSKKKTSKVLKKVKSVECERTKSSTTSIYNLHQTISAHHLDCGLSNELRNTSLLSSSNVLHPTSDGLQPLKESNTSFRSDLEQKGPDPQAVAMHVASIDSL